MSRSNFLSAAIVTVAMTFVCVPQFSAAAEPEPGHAVVSLYRVAPGKHLELLKWFAAREALEKEVGVKPTQWYMHVDGDSWDFIAIGPELTDEQDARIDELARKKGLKVGLKGALEFRQYIASHTDTSVRGPMTATEIVQAAGN